MSSGGKRVEIALKERPVSGDIALLQTLAAANVAELLHAMYEGRATYEAGAGGVELLGTPSVPGRALVFGGLRCDPQSGLTDLLITPGAALLGSPDSSPDAHDSEWKWVVDPGVRSLGSLNFTPNGGGSPRVDVVECRVNDVLLESASRQVWVGEQFAAPAPVQKVRARQLDYRIRLGSVGGGFPGTSAGWLPLMVVSAPTGAAVWDDCVLWDVRPLLADLTNPSGVARDGKRTVAYQWATSTPDPLPPSVPLDHLYVQGRVEAHLGGRFVAGGSLDDGQGLDSVDVLDSANHDATATPFVAGQPWYLWAVFPFSLPRWCRYDSSLAPGPCRGIALVSRTGPSNQLGVPGATLLPPAALGLGGGAATTEAALLLAGLVGGATNRVWGVQINGAQTRHFVYGAYGTIAPTATTADTATWTLTDGTHIPANARAVLAVVTANVTGMTTAGTTLRQITLRDASDSYDLHIDSQGSLAHAAADPATFSEVFSLRIPIQDTTGSPGLKSRKLKWTHSYNASTGGAVGSPLLTILGWELGT